MLSWSSIATNYTNLSGLKQTFLMSQFLWVGNRGAAGLSALFWLSVFSLCEGFHPHVNWSHSHLEVYLAL
jgi:hypothetical protein